MDLIHNLNLPTQEYRLEEKPIISGVGAENNEIKTLALSTDNLAYQYLEGLEEFVHLTEKGEQIETTQIEIAKFAISALRQHIEASDKKIKQDEATIIEAKNTAAEAKKVSYTDSLTGAYKREYFEDFIKSEFDPNKENLAIVLLDAVKLKMINDNYGHLVGDVLIKTMASSLNGLGFNEADFLVRAGGDEFIFVYRLPNEDNFEEAEVLARIKSQINDAKIYFEKIFDDYIVNNKDMFQKQLNYRAAFSSGIAFTSIDMRFSETLHCADMLMYEDKRANSN